MLPNTHKAILMVVVVVVVVVVDVDVDVVVEEEGERDNLKFLQKKLKDLAWVLESRIFWEKIFPPKNQQRVAKFFCSNPTIH